MSKKEKIQRGGLAGKMAGYSPEPPDSVWEGVAAEIRSGGSRRKLFIFLAAAAGLALAVTVGVLFLDNSPIPEMALQVPAVVEDQGSNTGQDTAAKGKLSPGREFAPQKDLSIEEEVLHGRRPSPEMEDFHEMQPPHARDPALTKARRLEQPSADISLGPGESIAVSADKTADKKQVMRLEEKVRIAVQEVFEETTSAERLAVSGVTNGVAPVDTFEVREDEESKKDTSKVPAVPKDSLLIIQDSESVIEPEPAEKGQSGRWQLGASLTPLYNYRDVTSQDDYSKALANSSESARLTFAGGVQVSYQQSDRLSVESGLYYTRMGVNIGDYSNFKNGWFNERLEASPGVVENVVSISNSMGKIVSANNDLFVGNYGSSEAVADYHMLYPEQMMVDNSIVMNFSQSFEYLEIPLNIKYMIIDRAVQVRLIGGVSTNVMINNSVSAHTGEGAVEVGKSEDLRSMNYSGNAGVGVVYDLFESFSLSVEPKFRYYLNSVNTDRLPSTRPYTFGLYTGVSYTF
jgi:hypothetical protein